MGLFLQTALIADCDEQSARRALEEVSKNPEFSIDLKECQYAQFPKGTQVLIEGDMGFDTLAKALSDTLAKPVMLLFIYDDDFWGYDFYMGKEEDHFNTIPDYFGDISKAEKQSIAGHPYMLAKWFKCSSTNLLKYLIHWSDYDMDNLDKMGKAFPQDKCTYGDCWQMADFAASLGFLWPFDEDEDAPFEKPQFPSISKILKEKIPSLDNENLLREYPLLGKLPSAFSFEYVEKLLKEDGFESFKFEDKTPLQIIEEISKYNLSVKLSECDKLCQRLSVLVAFCSFWLGNAGDSWTFLDRATYEPLYGTYEKPTDIYLLRARAAVTMYTKHHRAIRDLKRLQEIDEPNYNIYQKELDDWDKAKQITREEWNKAYERVDNSSAEKEAANERRIQRRRDRVLKKREKIKKSK